MACAVLDEISSVWKTSVGCEGTVGPACKATGFMTIDEYIAEAVNRHCFGGHDHIQSLSGSAKSCEKYHPRLVAAILRALRQSMRAAGRRGTRNDGTRSTADNRGSGGWADSGGARVVVAPCQR